MKDVQNLVRNSWDIAYRVVVRVLSIDLTKLIWLSSYDQFDLTNLMRVALIKLMWSIWFYPDVINLNNYLPQGLPRALWTREAPAKPRAKPYTPLSRVWPETILLLLVLVVVQGLKIWLAMYWVATPSAAPVPPAAVVSMTLLPVKNLVRWGAGKSAW